MVLCRSLFKIVGETQLLVRPWKFKGVAKKAGGDEGWRVYIDTMEQGGRLIA
jgi:hypothetical protein